MRTAQNVVTRRERISCGHVSAKRLAGNPAHGARAWPSSLHTRRERAKWPCRLNASAVNHEVITQLTHLRSSRAAWLKAALLCF
jgi:hypothetical protein